MGGFFDYGSDYETDYQRRIFDYILALFMTLRAPARRV